ncbi:hypothetical protein [Streptomyces sp. NBC_01197]|uniref:hypothetical protein n=1 Tax=Streptomyces sp. NBC_01197 TaxID=2903768 RepID=UPI002E0FE793|nr:hypothetical protein OG452_32370 [Streptomyces sp. NBC_01197]
MSPPPSPGESGAPALELLVHGVGGATPQGMLGDAHTVRITGDETAAVYRRAVDTDADAHPQNTRGRPVPEAYVWSNLTSGNSARALWLLLLPFMVVNLAHWMLPSGRGGLRVVRLYGVLVRLVALSLTVLLVASACEVALDLTAWQCAGSSGCSDGKSWLGFLAAAHGGWWAQPGRRLAAAALVPSALTALLWYLSNRTWSAYESQQPLGDDARAADAGDPGDGDGDGDGGGPGPALGRPGFWYGRRLVARLRAAHTAAGFLTVAAALTVATAAFDRRSSATLLEAIGWLLEATLLVAAAVVVWVVCRRGRTETRLDEELDRAVVTLLPGGALTLLGLSALYAAWSRPGWQSSGTLPGDRSFGILTLAQLALVVVLTAVAMAMYRRSPHTRTALRGLAGPAVALLACALGGVMTGGVAQRVADWLDGPGTPGMGRKSSIAGPPVLLSWQASVIPVLLLLLLLPVAYYALRTLHRERRIAATLMTDYPHEKPDTVRTRQIAGIRARAQLTDAAPPFVGIVSAATLLLGGGALTGSWLSEQVPGRAADDAPSFIAAATDAAQAAGSWLVGLGFILFVTLGRRAYRDASARRSVGILWDVGTFWPRAAHPFAPPCYAERAVPDLTWRMFTWTDRTGGRLVISGHSQGSVLAAAAVWQLPARTRSRVALLTYGSPLERLYGRWFPAYFGPDCLDRLHREVPCWRNLWRATDPIGGWVLRDGDVDRGPLLDPAAYGRTREHPLPDPVLGHSDYQADPAFAEERGALLDRLATAVPRQAAHQAAHQNLGPPGGDAGEAGSGPVTGVLADPPETAD